jgi:hypothetical protein
VYSYTGLTVSDIRTGRIIQCLVYSYTGLTVVWYWNWQDYPVPDVLLYRADCSLISELAGFSSAWCTLIPGWLLSDVRTGRIIQRLVYSYTGLTVVWYQNWKDYPAPGVHLYRADCSLISELAGLSSAWCILIPGWLLSDIRTGRIIQRLVYSYTGWTVVWYQTWQD